MSARVKVSSQQYLESLGFAIWVFKAGKIGTRDLYKGSKRAFGEFMEHIIRGKLAELAFKNFIQESYGTELLTEVDLPAFLEGDYLPDIVAYKQSGEWRAPAFWADIKAEQEGQNWMLIRTSSLLGGRTKRTKVRRYDAYVNVLVRLPSDHLPRILKHVPSIGARMSPEMLESLADLPYVEADVLGYVLLSDLIRIPKAEDGDEGAREELNSAFGQGNWAFFAKGDNAYDPDTGKGGAEMQADNCAVALAHLRNDWQEFLKLLSGKGPSSEPRSSEQKFFEEQISRALKTLAESGVASWFSRPLPPGPVPLSWWYAKE